MITTSIVPMRIAWRPLAANSLRPPKVRDANRPVRAVSTTRLSLGAYLAPTFRSARYSARSRYTLLRVPHPARPDAGRERFVRRVGALKNMRKPALLELPPGMRSRLAYLRQKELRDA